MTSDMSGAAAVVATVVAAAAAGPAGRGDRLRALAENLPSGSAYRPGDVLRHYGGVDARARTDRQDRARAEHRRRGPAGAGRRHRPGLRGRARLPAGDLDPDRRAGRRAGQADDGRDGHRRTCATGSPNWPARSARAAGRCRCPSTCGRAWTPRWPICRTSPASPGGGMLVAGHYLAEFVADGVKWAHLDIAGPAFNDGKALRLHHFRRHRGAGPDPAGRAGRHRAVTGPVDPRRSNAGADERSRWTVTGVASSAAREMIGAGGRSGSRGGQPPGRPARPAAQDGLPAGVVPHPLGIADQGGVVDRQRVVVGERLRGLRARRSGAG